MNLSLEVARIIHPEYEWTGRRNSLRGSFAYSRVLGVFDHTTPEALGQMAVWLAKYSNDFVGNDMFLMLLRDDNPNKALAEVIVEAHNG